MADHTFIKGDKEVAINLLEQDKGLETKPEFNKNRN